MTVHEKPVGATVEWYTPPRVFERLGLRFDLDPASPGREVTPWIPAGAMYKEIGLTEEWFGLVWLNPPYGPALVPFVKRMIEHNNGVLLIAARTETRIFQRAAQAATVVCFLRDRLHFIRNDGFVARSSFASVLMGFGDVSANAIEKADFGWTVRGG